MEKIQEAINKARASREAKLTGGATPAVVPAAGPAAPAAVAAPIQPDQTAAPLTLAPSMRTAAPQPPAADAGGAPVPAPADPALNGQAPVPPTAAPVPGGAVLPAPPVAPANWTDLPSFTPALRRLRRNRIVTSTAGKEAMEFDVVRTRMLQQLKAHGWTRVAITSPGASCGKSTLALNLAFSLSRQRDQHTILCEMDMRKPSIAGTLGLSQKQHLSHVLDGRDRFENNAVRVGDNLILATNSGSVKASSELLQSASAAAALDDIQARYRPSVMIFDMPPMLTGDDTMAFLSQVDCVLLVAAAESTKIKQIDACERDIASQTNVMGVILNKCRYMDRDQNYGYYE